MKKKTVILLVLFAVILAGAFAGYSVLSERYEPGSQTAGDQSSSVPLGNTDNVTASAETEKKETVSVPPKEKKDPAPDFSVEDMNGDFVSMSDLLDGRPMIINFWASWCGPCCSELPHFDSAYAEYGDRITFMMVDLADGRNERVSSVKNFLEYNGFSFPVYFDSRFRATNAYGIYSIPLTVFIDPEGNIVEKQIGSMSGPTLTEKIKSLLGDE